MEISLRDRVALVTGGAVGIGAGVARTLARAGAHVVVCDIQTEGGQSTARDVAQLERRSLFVRADVAHADDVSALMGQIQAEFGRLDILVNNAGLEYFRSLEETTIDEWDRTLDVDLKAIFLVTKSALPLLKESPGAVIVNIASVHAHATVPNLGAYAAAKGGVVAITRSLAQDLGQHGIRAVSISPGFINTSMVEAWVNSTPDPQETIARVKAMHPVGRIGEPEDIGNLIAFVSSDMGGFITGANIIVDGGLTTMLHH